MKLIRNVMCALMISGATVVCAMDAGDRTEEEKATIMSALQENYRNIKKGDIYMAESNQYKPVDENDPNSEYEVFGPKVLKVTSHKDEPLDFLDRNSHISPHCIKRLIRENAMVRIYNMEARPLVEQAINIYLRVQQL